MTITRKESEESPAEAAPAPPSRIAGVAIFSDGAPNYAVFPLSGTRLHLGRDALIDAGIHDEFISKRHLQLDWNGQVFAVSDAGSSNGTFLDGHRITTRTALRGSAVVRIGRTLILCQPQGMSAADEDVQVAAGVVAGPKMQAIFRQIDEFANATESLLINGESGVGKEIAARRFHSSGPYARGPFIAVNCASIPRDLAERLLFGARRGAYSGAVADADGYVQAAHGGTLFLDEIAELDMANQAKLLRVLENREVLPLGATRPHRVELSVCAAVQSDLQQAVAAGRFRQDLYFRIGRPEVAIPPLRERREEIPLHIDILLRDFLATRQPPPAAGLSASAGFVEACLLRPWPGNVRELRTEVRTAALRAVMEKSATVRAEHLGERAGRPPPCAAPPAAAPPREDGPTDEALAAREAQRCIDVLRSAQGNVNRAAQQLGISRSKLRRLIDRHGIDIATLRCKL
jgi:transcriptional regulator with PAS, ATPase and Fis domain